MKRLSTCTGGGWAIGFSLMFATTALAETDFAAFALGAARAQDFAGRLHTADGEASLPPAVVASILGIRPPSGAIEEQWLAALAAANGDQPGVAVRIVLLPSEPFVAGSLIGDWAAAYAPAGEPVPEALASAAWQDLAAPPSQATPRVMPLAAETRIAALRLTATAPERGTLALPLARPLAARLYNATPTAWINVESEYTFKPPMGPPRVYPASDLLHGRGEWRNTGEVKHKDPFIPRAPISDLHPSWVVLSWHEPVSCRGVIVRGNLQDVVLYAYTGPDGLNPSVAHDSHWRRVRSDEIFRRLSGRHQRTTETWIAFPEIETRGIRLLINGTSEGPVARLEALLALAELTTPTVPLPAERPPAGVAIPYEIDVDGKVTLVVTDAEGRTIRNLMARRQRDAGANREVWDLKDSRSQLVPPGRYGFKGITHPPLIVRYQMTPYPNIGNHAPENTPWTTSHAGRGGWLADHSADGALATALDRVYLGSGTAEDGQAMIETDLDGRKQWGCHNFIAWTGPQLLAANHEAAFAYAWSTQASEWPGGADFIWRVDAETRETRSLATLPPTSQRARGVRGMAALDDRLLLALRGQLRWLVNAVSEADVEREHCRPILPGPDPHDRYDPDPRRDFLRLFRIAGTPPGQRSGLTYLTSEHGPETRQHILLAFNRPIELGTMVFPLNLADDISLRFSTLRPDATLPADLDDERLWQTVPLSEAIQGWSAVPFPPETVTRALRITFTKGEDDIFAEALDLLGDDRDQRAWSASLEGMKLLRRRYRSLLSEASIMVNSGGLNAAGEWDARRDAPLTPDEPAIYTLDWQQTQEVRGLAIKEIDAKRVEIDVFIGDDEQDVDIEDDALWRQVAEYTPPRRYYYHPDENYNAQARYMDGYVDFGPDVATRAVRLRMVEQWTTRADGRAGLYGTRDDRGGLDLSPSRCHVYGVAPLQYLGGAPEDPLASQRLEVVNLASGRIEGEWALPDGGALAVSPDGGVYGLSGNRILRLDLVNGEHEVVVEGLSSPRALAVDAEGRFFVFESAPELQQVRIYDRHGRLDGQLGIPNGFQVGPWEPTRFGNVTAISIDRRGQIWVAERQHYPKRTTVWHPDGAFRRELFGRTMYGGGGVVDPVNPNLLYYGPLEFEMNPESGLTRLRNLTWLGDTRAGEQPIYVDGRKYLVTRQSFFKQSVGIVYLYDDGVLTLAAAMGLADRFAPLTAPRFRALLAGKPLSDYQFVWSDLNGNGEVDPEEVRLAPRTIRDVAHFDPFLGVTAGNLAFEVDHFLPHGVPVYAVRELPFQGANVYRLYNGNYFMMGEARVRDPEGVQLWHYPTEGTGVHAYYSAGPLTPEQVVAEFSIVGHGVAPAGDLGEYLVTNSNPGAWHLWTADGLLASTIFLDQRDPRARRWNLPRQHQGMVVENITAGQEHFWGAVTQADDGRTLGVYRSCNVFEIEGMDRFRRFSGTLEVTEQNVRAALDTLRESAATSAYREARVAEAVRLDRPLPVAGDGSDWERIPEIRQDVPPPFAASLKIAYDASHLYALYEVSGMGPFENSGEDLRQLFKTGACVDLMLGADPLAPPDRVKPVAGDLRLLFAQFQGKPTAILFEAVVPGLGEQPGERFATMVFATQFDRIRQLDDARIVVHRRDRGYAIEAAVPLSHLGLPPADEQAAIRFDWGVLRADPEGHSVMGRHYWSNQATGILSDVAAEAALEPRLWGHLRFRGVGEQSPGRPPPPGMAPDAAKSDAQLDNLLDELLEELR